MSRPLRYIAALIFTLLFVVCHARNERDTLRVGSRLTFSENKGQWESNVLFRSSLRMATLWIEPDCFTLCVRHPDDIPTHPGINRSDRRRSHVYKIHFDGSSATAVVGARREDTYENYFIGKDRSRWASHVGVFQAVTYHDIYPGIDMIVYSAEQALKYDFIVNAGADPTAISMRYEGVSALSLREGNLIAKTSVLDMVELAPYAYQIIDGDTVDVKASYRLKGNRVDFDIDPYDKRYPLVIDPYLHFSTYTGSASDNWGTTSAYDSYKNSYTAGLVFGANYPTSTGAYDNSFNGSNDVGIFKFDTNGAHRLYATYLGGNQSDMPHSMFVNAFDELVIFGTTGSNNFPTTPNAYDTTFNGGYNINYDYNLPYPSGSDIFISRFSSDGTQLQASTYVGGSDNDGLNYENYYNNNMQTIYFGTDSLYNNYGDGARGELITDDQNNIYVGSTTKSTDFPVTTGCVQGYSGGNRDGVVFKLDYGLQHMMWSTYLGGSQNDAVYSIDVDSAYNLLVCGGTTSTDFPVTSQAYSTQYHGGSADGFVAKISKDGHTLMASTYFGSPAYDQCYFVRVGKQNDVFLFGQTKASGSTLVYNATYNTPNSGQFLARLSPNLDSRRWSTVFGSGTGVPDLSPTAFAADICNRVYVAGWGRWFVGERYNGERIEWNTRGTTNLTVTADAYQNTTDGQDFYVMSMDASASSLTYATFFGEPTPGNSYYRGRDHVDGGTSRFDRLGTLYQSVCASCSGTDNFPTTTGVWSTTNNSTNCNNALFRINISADFPVAEFVPPAVGCAPYTISFHNTGRGNTYHWDFGDGSTSTQANPTHTYSQPGVYTIRLIASLPMGCKTSDTMFHELRVLGNRRYSLDTISICPLQQVQIGITPQTGCTYRWISGNVSDPNVANPYITSSGHYTLVISTNNCSDTADQVVLLGVSTFTIAGDTAGCVSPINLHAQTATSAFSETFVWSHSPSFSDTINGDDPQASSIRLDLDSACWIYLHIVDALGCEGTDSVYIHFYNIMDTLVVTHPDCPDQCDGTCYALPSGFAVPPYRYALDGVTLPDSLASNLCPGTYTYLFQDSNGCAISRSFTINSVPRPVISHTVTHVHCHETATGAITLTVSGNGPFTYEWLDDGSTEPNRSNLIPGDYYVRIVDATGCVFFDTITVLENADMRASTRHLTNSCPELCNGSALVEASGGTAPFTYLWDNGETDTIVTDLCPGTHQVFVTDATGCQVSDTVHIDVVPTFDSVHAWADTNTIFLDQRVGLHVTAIPGATYSWKPSHLLVNPYAADVTTQPLQDTTTFYVVITDSNGCRYLDSVKINCIYVNCGEPNIFIPNTFTPNDDGINDRLCVEGELVVEFNLYIFTRWGELVYESHDINDCWDGRYKGERCLPGVYTYRCDIVCEANHRSSFKGDITLIR